MKATLYLLLASVSVALGYISHDGSCGGKLGQTCLNSEFGNCCSQHGYCGKTSAYCGTGCQSKWGSCSSSYPSYPQPPASKISKDGRCGNGVTCRGSAFGDCCSQYGYCGRTKEYCGTGCNALFGTCSQSVPPKTSSSKPIVVPTSTSKPAAPSATGRVSTNARCGYTYDATPGGMTCLGSKWGNCCSKYGYCGSTNDYCGTGCQSKYGSCKNQPISSSAALPTLSSSSAVVPESSTSSSSSAVIPESSTSSSSSEAPTTSAVETSSSASTITSSTSSEASSTSAAPANPSCTSNFVADPSFEEGASTPWTWAVDNPAWATANIGNSLPAIPTADTGSSFFTMYATWNGVPTLRQKLVGLKAGTIVSCSFRYAVAGIQFASGVPDQPNVSFKMTVDGKPCLWPRPSEQNHGWKSPAADSIYPVTIEHDEPEVEITMYPYTANGDLQAGLDNIEIVGVQACNGNGEAPVSSTSAATSADPTTLTTLTSSVTSSFSSAAPSATAPPTCAPNLAPCSLLDPGKCCSMVCANPGILGNTNNFPACVALP